MMEWQQLLVKAAGESIVVLFLLAAIFYQVKEIARLNLVVTETRKEKDAIMVSYLERVIAAVDRLDLPGPK